MASLGSSLKAMVSLVRVLTKICVCVPCRRRLFGSPEDVVVLETHVLCAYSVSLLSDLYSPFPFFCVPWLFPCPFFLSLSLSFVCARALPCGCGPPRLIPSRALTWLVLFPTSFSCVACVLVWKWLAWRTLLCIPFPALSFPPFSSSLHLPFLSFPYLFQP